MSTKLTDRTDALKRAIEFEEAYRGRISEVQTRKVLLAMHREVHGENLVIESVRAYLDGWLARKKGETKAGTLRRYEGSVKKFLDFLAVKADRELTFLANRDILAFRDAVARRLTPSSANTDLKVLRIALGQAWKDGILPANPAAQVDTLRVRNDRATGRRPFSVQEVQRILDRADNEWKGMILAGIYTGQRLGDIARLRWHQVDLDQGEIRFQTNKTGRVVLLPIAAPLKRYFQRQRRHSPEDPVFADASGYIERDGGEARRLSGQFYEILATSGLAPKRTKKTTGKGRSARRKTNPLSFHSLRHTATSLLKNAGVSEAIAMDIIGHDSHEISLNYTHIDHSAKLAALKKLPDFR